MYIQINPYLSGNISKLRSASIYPSESLRRDVCLSMSVCAYLYINVYEQKCVQVSQSNFHHLCQAHTCTWWACVCMCIRVCATHKLTWGEPKLSENSAFTEFVCPTLFMVSVTCLRIDTHFVRDFGCMSNIRTPCVFQLSIFAPGLDEQLPADILIGGLLLIAIANYVAHHM